MTKPQEATWACIPLGWAPAGGLGEGNSQRAQKHQGQGEAKKLEKSKMWCGGLESHHEVGIPTAMLAVSRTNAGKKAKELKREFGARPVGLTEHRMSRNPDVGIVQGYRVYGEETRTGRDSCTTE